MLYRSCSAVLAVAGAALVLASCGGGATKVETVAAAPSVATATQGTSTTSAAPSAAPTTQQPASGEVVKAYVDAFAKDSDPDGMREGLKSAAPGSPAYIYLSHLANVTEAELDGGQSADDENVVAVGSDAFKVCTDPADDKTCVTLGDFKVNTANLLVDLTVNKKAIAPRLTAGSGEAVKSGGAKFTFLTAYKSIQSGWLFVSVKIQTGTNPINPNLYSATYRSPNGKQRQATDAYGSVEVDADSNTIATMIFKGVEPGGRVTLDGCVTKSCGSQFKAVMKVG